MSAPFASPAWTDSLATALQDSAAVRTESISWVHGPLVLVIDGEAEHGLEQAGVRVDLHEGSVRSVDQVAAGDAARSPFVVGGSLAHWKAVFGGTLSIVDGILESKLRVRGDLPTLARHRALLDGIASVGGEVATSWQDEQEPAVAPAG